MRHIASAFIGLILGTAAAASGPGENHGADTAYLGNGVFTYEVFEASVAHSDLDSCPAQFDADAVFCRITLAADGAHVFVFSFDGAQPLLAVKHYDLNDGFLPF